MADSSLLDGGFELSRRAPRSEGMHASTLLRKLHPIKKRKPGEEMSPEQLALYGLIGLAFEDRAELALLSLSLDDDWPWHCFRPGEVHQDGIACSPDILLVPKNNAIDSTRELSLKVSWSSCKEWPTDGEGENLFPPGKPQYYIDQCMTYATPLDTLGSVLVAFFVNGDYQGARMPKVHGWELDYNEQERAETWDALLGIARGME